MRMEALVMRVITTQEQPMQGGEGPTTISENVEYLKRELGLSGTIKEVVDQAAVQLGINAGGRPLTEVATQCMKALRE